MTEPAGDAFLFSGQALQYVGMGQPLAERFDVARRTLAEADEALSEPLSRLIREGPAEELTLTANAQPAILAVSVAWARVLEAHGGRPRVVAGHSLGEYSALVAAGSLAFADAVRVVRRRGEAMQAAVPAGEGGMLALVGADLLTAEELCRRATAAGGLVQVAGENCPGNVTVSGSRDAVARAEALAGDLGLRAVALEVSAPFHCSLLVPAAAPLAEALADVELVPPGPEFWPNVTGEPESDPDAIRAHLVRQVFLPLQWRRTLEGIVGRVRRIVQVGPGRALLGHVKRVQRRFPVLATDAERDLEALLAEGA